MARTITTDGHHLSTTSLPVSAYPFSFSIWWKGVGTTNANHLTLMAIGNSALSADYMSLCMSNDATPDTNDSVDFQFRMLSAGVFLRAQILMNSGGTFAYTGVWHHFGGSITTGNVISVYLNGTTKATASGAMNWLATSNVFRVGARPLVGGSARGIVAHPAVWSESLSDAEFESLAGGASPLRVRSPALRFYAPTLGRDSSDADIVGARNLTVTGATASSDEPPVRRPMNPMRASQ